MIVDLDSVNKVAGMCYIHDAGNVFGNPGINALLTLLDGVREFFKRLPEDDFPGDLIFFVSIPDVNGIEDRLILNSDYDFMDLSASSLTQARAAVSSAQVTLIQILSSHRYRLATTNKTPKIKTLASKAIVLLNQNGQDQFFIGEHNKIMPSLIPGSRSNFSPQTISELNEALERYGTFSSYASCSILANIWIGGQHGPRLVFINKPESTMRHSLYNFLRTRLQGDVIVRQEHNTDERKSVDLSVNWFGQALRALIEIKWLGASESSSGTLTRYGTRRVQEGATQLVDYIEREKNTDPNCVIRGFLVVFDGRRKGLKSPNDSSLTEMDAIHYRKCKISLTNDPASTQDDVKPLIRYFLEPRKSFFSRN